jgi:hypothetical protein
MKGKASEKRRIERKCERKRYGENNQLRPKANGAETLIANGHGGAISQRKPARAIERKPQLSQLMALKMASRKRLAKYRSWQPSVALAKWLQPGS